MELKTLSIQKVQDMYLDRINNFLTNEKFAEYYGIEICEAELIISKGAEIHETYVNLYQGLRCLNNLK